MSKDSNPLKKLMIAGYEKNKQILVQNLTPFAKGKPLKDVMRETRLSELDITNIRTNIREPPDIVIYTVEKGNGKEEKWIKIDNA